MQIEALAAAAYGENGCQSDEELEPEMTAEDAAVQSGLDHTEHAPAPIATPRMTRYQGISAEAQRLLDLGESHLVEFKRDEGAVRPAVLAALANTAAMSPEGVACLLVGVEERKDPVSGLVTGVPFGVADLEKAVARIQDRARTTLPVPVDTFIVEEAFATSQRFLRVEIRATRPPHYDQEGHRQIRQNCSTRALTDDEMLSIYLDREANSFADRFRHTSLELREAVGGLGSQVDSISSAIRNRIAQPLGDLQKAVKIAATAASDAEAAAEMASYDVDAMERVVKTLQEMVEDLHNGSADSLASRLIKARRTTWWNFTVDTWERQSALATRVRTRLRRLLEADLSIDPSRNAWELQVWNEIAKSRERFRQTRGTLAWWDRKTAEAKRWAQNPAFAGPDLPDLRPELLADVGKALADPGGIVARFRRLIADE